jgi:New glue protein family
MADVGPVPIGDLEVADRIAKAVRRGRAADRRPTLEQLLAAFGEDQATNEARRRVARALALAGVATVPDLLEAAPGQRVVLEVRGPRKRHVLLVGILALAVLLGAAAALATTLDTSSTETGANLPADTTTAAPTTTTAPTTSTQTTATTPKEPSAAERRRERRAREKRAREKRERERRAAARAAARRRVTVRLTATQPTFLCVDGDGRRLFNGTLSGSRTFRAREVRMNVGLGPTTRVTANGKTVPLTSSPVGIRLTPKGQTPLPRGTRPCA